MPKVKQCKPTGRFCKTAFNKPTNNADTKARHRALHPSCSPTCLRRWPVTSTDGDFSGCPCRRGRCWASLRLALPLTHLWPTMRGDQGVSPRDRVPGALRAVPGARHIRHVRKIPTCPTGPEPAVWVGHRATKATSLPFCPKL